YDKMGNIKNLTRDGTAYTYDYSYSTPDGNQLKMITGMMAGSYHYDLNGNMDTDARSGNSLTYNILNLPATITKTNLNISYIYNAAGQKLKKVSVVGGVSNTTDYIGGIVYNYPTSTGPGAVSFVQTEEGRAARRSDGTYRYEYDLKDHLGNVRLTFQRNASQFKAERL
ncbi:RHS repeat-associated core domain-containing protein, partial [Mucilaginibacter lutimaris]